MADGAPVVLIGHGETELALSEEILEQIRVRPPGGWAMHTGGLTLFLVGVAVIGLAPLLFLVVYLARRAGDARRDDGNEVRVGSVGALRTVSIGLAGVAVVAVAVAWYLSSAGGRESVPRMHRMPVGGSATEASLEVLPRTLVGLPMTAEVVGPDAIREVAKLHGSDFPISSAEIARYGDAGVRRWCGWPGPRTTTRPRRWRGGWLAACGGRVTVRAAGAGSGRAGDMVHMGHGADPLLLRPW
ncbi:MAG: hypothetical protein HYU54_03545 [Actinobacteria bacterium]|nr:hypothetical protein [Actinomycetota bacterium]